MEVKKDFSGLRNELFKRQEVEGIVECEKNPGFDEVGKLVSEKMGKPEENLDVYGIKGNFGSKLFHISAYVYDSKEDKDKAEQKTKKQREEEKKGVEDGNKKEDSAESVEKPAEEVKKEEVEDKSEEVKEEKKEEKVEEVKEAKE